MKTLIFSGTARNQLFIASIHMLKKTLQTDKCMTCVSLTYPLCHRSWTISELKFQICSRQTSKQIYKQSLHWQKTEPCPWARSSINNTKPYTYACRTNFLFVKGRKNQRDRMLFLNWLWYIWSRPYNVHSYRACHLKVLRMLLFLGSLN